MANYDFTENLSPLDFELLSKDLLEADLGIKLENFKEGRDKGIDLRYAPASTTTSRHALVSARTPPALIVQCKRYSSFSNLKSDLTNKELAKIKKLNPARYILTTSLPLSPPEADALAAVLAPFVASSADIYGAQRLNALLTTHQDIERRHIKLWLNSAGVLDALLHSGTHVVSREEVDRTLKAARLYVQNESFQTSLDILKKHRVCIIAGQPGIGKTTLARMLLLHFYQREYDVVKVESDISEARALGYHSKPRFYLYDDFLGQTAASDKLGKNEDQKLLDFMASVSDSQDSVFVLTTREYILNQARLHYEKFARARFDYRTCIVDLRKYTRRMRAQILYNHLHFSDLPREHIEALIAKRGYAQIVDHPNYSPRLIEYLTSPAWVGDVSPDRYRTHFLDKLDHPFDIWDHSYRHQICESSRHLLLVLTTMPPLARSEDVERAFRAFHRAVSDRFGQPQVPGDYQRALKELEGTFVSSRMVGQTIVLSFQNPSIRDFMKDVVLTDELLADLILSSVFYEQAEWFAATSREAATAMTTGRAIRREDSNIVARLMSLVGAPSCIVNVGNDGRSHEHLWLPTPNPAERLAALVRLAGRSAVQAEREWFSEQLASLAHKVERRSLAVSNVIPAIASFGDDDLLSSDGGVRLRSALIATSLADRDTLEDFETISGVIDAFPDHVAESDLAAIRADFAEFADNYSRSCDIMDPDEIREESLRLGSVGESLTVATDEAQERLRDAAEQIESEGGGRPEPDEDEWREVDMADRFTESDLDSMFGTL